MFYSQYAAVRPDIRGEGLGIALKRFQAGLVRDQLGIRFITCTFDPLVGVNAYRNIHVFGTEVLDYKDACYADFGGRLNRPDIPCDRLLVSWDLERTPPSHEYDLRLLLERGHNLIKTEAVRVRGRSGPLVLDTVSGVLSPGIPDPVLIEIPFDFYALLEETAVRDEVIRRIPLTWRMRIREAFHAAMASGFRVTDFRTLVSAGRKRDFYILERPQRG
jgi:predicted GNAT superfamily acetyltransferase